MATRQTTLDEANKTGDTVGHEVPRDDSWCFGGSALRRDCCQKYGWSDDFSWRVLRGYRQFLACKVQVMKHSSIERVLEPSPFIEKMWLKHIHDTVNYISTCSRTFGVTYIHRLKDSNAETEAKSASPWRPQNGMAIKMALFNLHGCDAIDPEVWNFDDGLPQVASSAMLSSWISLPPSSSSSSSYSCSSSKSSSSAEVIGGPAISSVVKSLPNCSEKGVFATTPVIITPSPASAQVAKTDAPSPIRFFKRKKKQDASFSTDCGAADSAPYAESRDAVDSTDPAGNSLHDKNEDHATKRQAGSSEPPSTENPLQNGHDADKGPMESSEAPAESPLRNDNDKNRGRMESSESCPTDNPLHNGSDEIEGKTRSSTMKPFPAGLPTDGTNVGYMAREGETQASGPKESVHFSQTDSNSPVEASCELFPPRNRRQDRQEEPVESSHIGLHHFWEFMLKEHRRAEREGSTVLSDDDDDQVLRDGKSPSSLSSTKESCPSKDGTKTALSSATESVPQQVTDNKEESQASSALEKSSSNAEERQCPHCNAFFSPLNLFLHYKNCQKRQQADGDAKKATDSPVRTLRRSLRHIKANDNEGTTLVTTSAKKAPKRKRQEPENENRFKSDGGNGRRRSQRLRAQGTGGNEHLTLPGQPPEKEAEPKSQDGAKAKSQDGAKRNSQEGKIGTTTKSRDEGTQENQDPAGDRNSEKACNDQRGECTGETDDRESSVEMKSSQKPPSKGGTCDTGGGGVGKKQCTGGNRVVEKRRLRVRRRTCVEKNDETEGDDVANLTDEGGANKNDEDLKRCSAVALCPVVHESDSNNILKRTVEEGQETSQKRPSEEEKGEPETVGLSLSTSRQPDDTLRNLRDDGENPEKGKGGGTARNRSRRPVPEVVTYVQCDNLTAKDAVAAHPTTCEGNLNRATRRKLRSSSGDRIEGGTETSKKIDQRKKGTGSTKKADRRKSRADSSKKTDSAEKGDCRTSESDCRKNEADRDQKINGRRSGSDRAKKTNSRAARKKAHDQACLNESFDYDENEGSNFAHRHHEIRVNMSEDEASQKRNSVPSEQQDPRMHESSVDPPEPKELSAPERRKKKARRTREQGQDTNMSHNDGEDRASQSPSQSGDKLKKQRLRTLKAKRRRRTREATEQSRHPTVPPDDVSPMDGILKNSIIKVTPDEGDTSSFSESSACGKLRPL